MYRVQRFLVRQWTHVSSSLRRPRILRPILVLLSFVSVYSAMLGPQWYMFASFYGLVEFLVFST